MRVPAARERVRVDGRSETFLVIWVDHDRQTADLIPLAEGDVLDSVPFSRILPVHDRLENGGRI